MTEMISFVLYVSLGVLFWFLFRQLIDWMNPPKYYPLSAFIRWKNINGLQQKYTKQFEDASQTNRFGKKLCAKEQQKPPVTLQEYQFGKINETLFQTTMWSTQIFILCQFCGTYETLLPVHFDI